MLAGVVLGQRFKVLVLGPAIALVVVVCVGAWLARAAGLWPTLLLGAASVASLQFGYFSGIGLRYVLAASRAGRLRVNSLSGAAPPRRAAH